jgi:hypothetical protein
MEAKLMISADDAISYLHGIETGKKEGRREVMEWVKSLYHYNTFETFPLHGGTATEICEARTMVVKHEEWQAKLKEWGIE